MKTVLVVAAAALPADDPLIAVEAAASSLVIAADAGALACMRAGVRPGVVVGDMDSIDRGLLAALTSIGAEIITVPTEKDETDLELAVGVAISRGADEIAIAGALGERLDHTLAALGTALAASEHRPRFVSATDPSWVLSAAGRQTLNVPASALFSVLALGDDTRVSVDGARWPLNDHALALLSPLGVSNVAGTGGAAVAVLSGCALVTLPTDAGSCGDGTTV